MYYQRRFHFGTVFTVKETIHVDFDNGKYKGHDHRS